MRLTCPTCRAQYEVQDTLIPAAGRDVQCSACSTTWFQPGARMPEPELAGTEAVPDGPVAGAGRAEAPRSPDPARTFARSSEQEAVASRSAARPDAAPAREELPSVANSELEPEPGPRDLAGTRLSGDMETATRIVEANDPAEDEDDAEAELTPAGAKRGLDPSVRDILRSEAEREARLRRAEATPVETQAEMPLEAGPGASDMIRRRRVTEEAADVFEIRIPDHVKPITSRGDLLPDIEEINATLRARPPHGPDMDEAAAPPPSPEVVRRRGVRIGFFTTLALVAALVLVYANAGDIARELPDAAPALEWFAARIDGLRLWLDDLARGLAEGGPGA